MLPWVSSLLGFLGRHLGRDSRHGLLSRAWRNIAPKGHDHLHLRVSISVHLAHPTAREPGRPEKATLLGFLRLTLPHARTKPLPGYWFTSCRVVPCSRPPTLLGSSLRSAGAAWDRQRRQTGVSKPSWLAVVLVEPPFPLTVGFSVRPDHYNQVLAQPPRFQGFVPPMKIGNFWSTGVWTFGCLSSCGISVGPLWFSQTCRKTGFPVCSLVTFLGSPLSKIPARWSYRASWQI
jgi:hypothetical protein